MSEKQELKVLTLKKSEWLTPDHVNWDSDSGLCIRMYAHPPMECGEIIAAPMCCLGVLAHQLGEDKEELFNAEYPSQLEDLPPGYPEELMDNEREIGEINDNGQITR